MKAPTLRNGAAYAGLTIGLLGGSFNPAHDGHLDMSLHALKRLKLDQVWWLVSPQNPLKPTKGMADLHRRTEHARQVARHPKLVVTDLESMLGTRYTADTLRVLKRRFPHTRFVWLMGADNLRQIHRWKGWQDIFAAVPVAVFRRPGYPAGNHMGKAPIRFDRARITPAHARRWQDYPLPIWVILDNKLNYTSATAIRKDHTSWPA